MLGFSVSYWFIQCLVVCCDSDARHRISDDSGFSQVQVLSGDKFIVKILLNGYIEIFGALGMSVVSFTRALV